MPRPRPVLATAAYIGLSVVDSIAAGRGGTAARGVRHVVKPLLMPTLAAAFLDDTRGRTDHALLLRGTAAAQALSWGGDVALLGSGRRAFLTGVAAFFGAHVAYVAAFASVRGPRAGRAAAVRLPLALWLTTAPVMSSAAARKDPALRAPVAAYATILSAMFAASRLLDPALPRGARRAVQAGTTLFVVSDAALATQMFVLREPRPALDSFVMATYTAGQGLIAAGARAT